MTKKPNTTEAMRHLIDEVKKTLPLDLSPIQACSDDCRFCSIKLIEYISSELESWEGRLNDGNKPDFGDLNRLAKSSKKIYAVMKKKGMIEKPTSQA